MPTMCLVFFFSIGTLMFPEPANTWLHGTTNAAIASFDWLFAPTRTFKVAIKARKSVARKT